MRVSQPTKLVGDVLKLEYGKPLPESQRTSDGGVPAYGANGVLCRSRKAFRTEPSIIVGRKGSAGEVNLAVGPFWPTDVTYFVEHDETASDLKYLFYGLKHLNLRKLAKGVKPGINRNDVYALAILVPPLPEQKRIVAILDEAFEGIDTAVANTEKNLANAREVFGSYLNSIFAQKGDRWVQRKLEDTVEKTCSLSYGIVQPGEDVPGGLPVVRPTDLRSKVINLDGLKRIDPTLADAYKRTKLNGDELLLCVRGGTGSVSIAAKELAGSNVTRGIVPIRFDGSVVIQELGYFAFISDGVQAQIRAATYGAALMQINIRDLRKITLEVPPLDVQKDLLEKLGNISAEVECLASINARKAVALAELKQAILHKAFAGELTAHPEMDLPAAAE